MSVIRTIAVSALVLLATVLTSSASAEPGFEDFDALAATSDDTFSTAVVAVTTGDQTRKAAAAASSSGEPVVEYLHGPGCTRFIGLRATPRCPEGMQAQAPVCIDGSAAVEPLYARTQNTDGSWGRWRALASYTCPHDEAVVAAVLSEWSTLEPEPTTATIQPDRGWVYANMPTIVMADGDAQMHAASLLGADVDIRATPATFTWTWGDGDQTVTHDPGALYPHQTVTHTYSHFTGNATVSLQTAWDGHYRINGGAWVAFATQITSDSPPVTLEVANPRSKLVACTTDGHCR